MGRPGRRGGAGAALVFVFQRDLRVADNPGFRAAAESAAARGLELVPAFLLDDRQLDARRNPYRSERCVALMARALAGLDEELAGLGWGGLLIADFAEAAEVLAGPAVGAVEVRRNTDHTPFAALRDGELSRRLAAAGVACVPHGGPEYTLYEPGSVRPRSGKEPAYVVFSAFLAACARAGPPPAPDPRPPPRGDRPPGRPRPAAGGSAAQRAFLAEFERAASSPAERPRAAALRTLALVASGAYDGYGRARDRFAPAAGPGSPPPSDSRTGLSAPMKFGCVSCREVMAAASRVPDLARQLMWREHYAHVAHGFPAVLAGQTASGRERANRHARADRDAALDSWRTGAGERRALRAWEEGRTGEPLVDAAMKELRATGRLHNRLRMVVASHLVKALGVDWRLGERSFARMLEDYDPCSNGGGWRDVDAQRPGREIRAPAQARRFDPRGDYVRGGPEAGAPRRGEQRAAPAQERAADRAPPARDAARSRAF